VTAPAVDGYWCELTARSEDVAAQWLLGRHRARTPHEALGWLRERAGRIVAAAPGSVPGQVFRGWLADTGYQEVQLRTLEGGGPISVSAGSHDRIAGCGRVHVRYVLSCRPLPALAA
jgi:hypothetical protein